MRLTGRQLAILRRLARDAGTGCISADVGRQLLRKGLIFRHDRDYHRVEWGKVVATLWRVTLTPAGQAVSQQERV